MKTIFTTLQFIQAFCFLLFLFPIIQVAAQPDFDFRNPALESDPSTDLNVGAVYRFQNVKPGVDAIVTITDITGGITIADIDAGSGYPEALQPTLNSPANSNGYLEMQVDFVYAGTSTLFPQIEVPVTCIDVDGNNDNDGLGNPIWEFDQIKMGGGYIDYQMAGTELSVLDNGTWVTGKNIGGIDYPGRDTSAKVVMFSAINANIASFTIRVGVDNLSTSDSQRLRSVYFKKFNYGNIMLAVEGLLSFKGVGKENTIDLEWTLTPENAVRTISIERGAPGGQFTIIKEFNSWEYGNNPLKFSYSDSRPAIEKIYYRLKIRYQNGSVKYSNILVFQMGNSLKNELKIYPSLVHSSATAQISNSANELASFNVLDYTGKIVKHQAVALQKGENIFQVDNLDRLPSGNYIVIVKTPGKIYSSKISRQ